jgi:titin
MFVIITFKITFYHINISGNPTAEVSWYKDGKKLTPDANIKVSSEEDGSFFLLFNEASLDQSGEYTCKAKNPVGTVEAKFSINVKGL